MSLNVENLRKLAVGLLSPPDERNKNVRFDMSWFCDKENNMPGRPDGCGSCGCAIGWATFYVRPIRTDETWFDYAVDITSMDTRRTQEECDQFEWCFGGAWAKTDNTKEGAGRRILYMLEYGLPENWLDQQRGCAPLCYLPPPTTETNHVQD